MDAHDDLPDVLEGMIEQEFSRGDFLRRSALLGLTLGGAGALFGGAARHAYGASDSGSVIVCTWGGSYTDAQKKAYFDAFSKSSGITVTTTGTPDAAKMLAMAQTGNIQWDIVDAEGQMMYTAADKGILQPIDYSRIYRTVPKSKLITQSLKPYGFPSIAFGWVLAWNTKTAKRWARKPATWADFWNLKQFPGRRALYDNAKPNIEIALLADGVPKNKLYPLDMNRAFKKLNKIKKHVGVFYSDLAQVDTFARNGEVDLLLSSNGRAYTNKLKGAPIDFTFNQGGWEQGYWVVMKGSPNVDAAMQLIAFTAKAGPEALFAKLYAYGGPNKDSYKLMGHKAADGLPTAPQNLPKQFQINTRWWTDNLDEANKRWLAWKTS